MENLIDKRQITARVTKISWERIWLHLEVKVTYAGDADRESPLSFIWSTACLSRRQS